MLHVVGKEDRVLLNTGIMQIPSATITLENGDEYQGALEPGAGDGSQAYEVDGKFVATASITLPADLPMGYHTLHGQRGRPHAGRHADQRPRAYSDAAGHGT